MGFWSKLGKLGLAVAPYVAAPFTGGASLMFAPATDAALGQWNRKDAEKRAAQGLGPSSFDKWLGIGSGVASIGSSLGAFSGLGALRGAGYVGKSVSGVAKAASAAGKAGGIGGTLGNIYKGANVAQQGLGMAAASGMFGGGDGGGDDSYSYGNEDRASSGSGKPSAAYTARQNRTSSSSSGIGPSGRYSNVDFGFDYNDPNIADAIAAGRIQAQRDRGTYNPSSYDYGGHHGGSKPKKAKKLTKKQSITVGRANVNALKKQARPYAPESMRMKFDNGRGL